MKATPLQVLRRSLRLRCPVCGGASIVERPFHVRHHCPACRALFKREEGFFVGAIAINLVTTEAVILLVYLASLPFVETHFQMLLNVMLVLALVFPIVFYHHSWSLWLGFDHVVETLPVYEGTD
ncbi:MAG TPA: DUF983 domain-containing protein [Pyrinomonadaceae bacterium]|nr:DUF983 domain-containing protein [Pyrinomonadaceae bacterium]